MAKSRMELLNKQKSQREEDVNFSDKDKELRYDSETNPKNYHLSTSYESDDLPFFYSEEDQKDKREMPNQELYENKDDLGAEIQSEVEEDINASESLSISSGKDSAREKQLFTEDSNKVLESPTDTTTIQQNDQTLEEIDNDEKREYKCFSTMGQTDDEWYGKCDLNGIFHPLGEKVTVEKIIRSVEDDTLSILISYPYAFDKLYRTVSRADITDTNKILSLSLYGVNVTRQTAPYLIDSLRFQEHFKAREPNGIEYVHKELGWANQYDDKGQCSLYFKAYTSINSYIPSTYCGSKDVSQGGRFVNWLKMFSEDIMSHTGLEFMVLAAMSSVIIGYINNDVNIGNPIFHYYDESSRGKTTAAMLAASTGGKPFQGSVRTWDGQLVNSLYGNWSGTANALMGANKGNHGYPIILDELGKASTGINFDSLIFSLADGEDKSRMNKDLVVMRGERFEASVISIGETSLLQFCKTQKEGLNMRVFECSGMLTESAEHAKRINETVQSNYGYMIPFLAEYIINQGYSIDDLIDLHNKCCQRLESKVPNCVNKDRIIQKFYAVIYMTALLSNGMFKEISDEYPIANECKFKLNEIVNFMNLNLKNNAEQSDKGLLAYNTVLSVLESYRGKIYFKDTQSFIPDNCWGRYEKQHKSINGKKVIGIYSIIAIELEKILKNNGFDNIPTILKHWKRKGYLDYGEGTNTRYKKITGDGRVKCYVLRVFDNESHAENGNTSEIKSSKNLLNDNNEVA